MNQIVNRAILAVFVFALFFPINCTVGDKGFNQFSGNFKGCFQGVDSEGQPIILNLNSPKTATSGPSDGLIGIFTFVDEDLRRCYVLQGDLNSRKKATLEGSGKVSTTVTRSTADGIVIMTMKFSDESIVGPLERKSDPSVELYCLAECP